MSKVKKAAGAVKTAGVTKAGAAKAGAAKGGAAKGGAAPVATTRPTTPPVSKTYALHQDRDGHRYWLIKSEPHKFLLGDLRKVKTEPWDGVRNYEARNHMIHMAVGDTCLFYHSNAAVPGIVGVATVAHAAHLDESQYDPTNHYYDPSHKWWCVDVAFERVLRRRILLAEIRDTAALKQFRLVTRGRLLVIPVEPSEFDVLMTIEQEQDADADIQDA